VAASGSSAPGAATAALAVGGHFGGQIGATGTSLMSFYIMFGRSNKSMRQSCLEPREDFLYCLQPLLLQFPAPLLQQPMLAAA